MKSEAQSPQFHIVLVEPEIPNNTGNIGRTCVGASCHLHLVGPLGFELSDRQLKRAGLDYWPYLKYTYYENWSSFWSGVKNKDRCFFFTTKTKKTLFEGDFRPGDWFIFGKETKGLDPSILDLYPNQQLTIPMFGPIRSLNLATAAAIVMYEGLRQTLKK